MIEAPDLQAKVLDGMRRLPLEKQQEVLTFVEEVLDSLDEAEGKKTIWDKIAERVAKVPPEEWDKLPYDGAEQHDHYLYGAPKR